ncbi:MAG: inner membrane CreD family protein, partial [Alcanivorax nanhaiticus]
MRNNLFLKMLTITGLLLVLVIPLMMIQGKISDREHEAWQVRASLSEQVGGEQILSGPVVLMTRTI